MSSARVTVGESSRRSADYACSTRDSKGVLPHGWRYITNNGRSFYHHVETDVSTWKRPTDATPPEQDPLPPGWEQVTDGEDVFYYHAATDTSTWNRPHAAPPDLPAGWQRCHDDEGDVFYHNTVTGKSTWTKPTAPAGAGAGNSAAAGTPATATSAANGSAGTGASDDPDAGLPPAEQERRRKARAARQVAVEAIASAERNRAARAKAAEAAGGAGGAKKGRLGPMRRSSWRLLRAMVRTRAALNQHLSKAKRRRLRRGVFARAAGTAEADEALTGDPPSTPAALGAIAAAMGHFLFQSLPEAQRDAVVQGMRARRYEEGSKIIVQGHTDSNVFVLEEGTLEFVVDGDAVSSTHKTGTLFGELALLYDAPRAATVVAKSDCNVWVMTAATFRRLVREASAEEQAAKLQLLKGVPTLTDLANSGAGVDADPEELLAAMASELTEVRFKPGATIVSDGDPLLGTYIVKSGLVHGTIFGNETELTAGDFFGAADYRGDEPMSPQTMTAGDDGAVIMLLHRTSLRLLVQSARKRTELAASKTEEADVPRVPLTDVEVLGPLGEGSFGVVKMVRWRGEVLALKALNKHYIAQARQVKHVLRERRILGSLHHPFVVNLRGTCEDPHKLYMLLELVQGGELWSLIYNETSTLTHGEGGMPDDAARFYTANVILGMEYLHEQSIAFRDLKPENLLVTSTGYLKFVDFGFAKQIPFLDDGVLKLKSGTMLGSPDYLAPELILRNGHDHTVDLWALGVIVFELLSGETAFDEENRNKGYERACRADVRFSDAARKRSPGGCALVEDLLRVEPHQRIGAGGKGMEALKAHKWFKGLDWEALAARTLAAPFVPPIKGPDDRSNFELEEEEEAGGGGSDEDDGKPDMDAPYTGDQSIWEGF